MKRYVIDNSNKFPHFIGSWMLDDTKICEELISYFEKRKSDQKKGATIGGINEDVKKSIDLTIRPKDILAEDSALNSYFHYLNECYKDYVAQWDFLKTFAEGLEIGSFNIQKYNMGGHFNEIHTERTSLLSAHRVFAWMTYLNDVGNSGETFFKYYNLSIKPKKGLTLIWPAEWTHAHQGRLLHQGQKYIITGWMHLKE